MRGMKRKAQKNDVVVGTELYDFDTNMGCMPVKYQEAIFALESPSGLWLKAPGENCQIQSKSHTKSLNLGIPLEPLRAQSIICPAILAQTNMSIIILQDLIPSLHMTLSFEDNERC